MNKRIEWLRPASPVGAILFLLLLTGLRGGPVTHAQDTDNLVRINPSGVAAAPGGTFKVAVMDDPPVESLAAWVIEISFDPSVITTSAEECRSLSTPGGAVGAFACEVTDDNGDGEDETIKMLGAVLFTRSEKGLVNETKLADITFHAVGGPGTCSDIKLRNRIHANSEGDETGARVQDGRACILGDAPATGTASPFPVTPRTSEPTPLPGEDTGQPTIPPIGGNTDEPTITLAPNETQDPIGPVRTLRPGETRGPTPTPTRPPATNPGATTDEDGGTDTVIWVIVGVAVLIVAGAGAWGVVRMRGRGPDGGGPGATS